MLKVIGALAAVAALALLPGCQGGSQFSSTEVKQIQSGPPRQIPPQALEMMRRAREAKPPARPASAHPSSSR